MSSLARILLLSLSLFCLTPFAAADAKAFDGGIASVMPGKGAAPSAEASDRAPTESLDAPFDVAQADCAAAAAEAAARTGGQVLSVKSRSSGGRTVCVVTLLVPGQDGGRPRKTTVTISQ